MPITEATRLTDPETNAGDGRQFIQFGVVRNLQIFKMGLSVRSGIESGYQQINPPVSTKRSI